MIENDAVLHIVTIGVVLMLIIGMAQLLLPQFASERIGGPQSRWRSEAFGVALSVAVVLRAGGGYFAADCRATGGTGLRAAAPAQRPAP